MLIQKVLPFVDFIKHFLVGNDSCFLINIEIILWVLNFEVGLLNEAGDIFKFIIGIVWVMKHNSIEYLGQMAI